MTNEPLVSIITPCYNHEKFIAQCIESVISQTYRNWEMIVVDDRSRDGSLRIVEDYVTQDSRIKIIRHEVNYGAGRLVWTYNEALNASSGELVAILEGDDYWATGKLKAQIPAFRDENVVLVYSDFDEISDHGELIKRHRVPIERGSFKTAPSRNLKFFSQLRYFAPNTVVIRREPLLRTGGFVSANIPVVDFPTFLQLSLEGDFVRIPSVLAYYQRHTNSVAFDNVETIALGSAEFMREFLRRNEARVEQLSLRIEDLQREAEEALQWQRNTAAYFEGKYRLIFGEKRRARRCFLRAIASESTPLKHKVVSLVGVLASLTSRRLFFMLSDFRERLSSSD
ncbi:MAG: glycosyltransferase family 2 protein [Solirubrobacterales bacterium]|nr:glycosyltransferase family 2 protein [Solirubrobacterales bacterium]